MSRDVAAFLSAQLAHTADGMLRLKDEDVIRAWLVEQARGDRLVPILEDWLLFGEWLRVEQGSSGLQEQLYLLLLEIRPRIEEAGLAAMFTKTDRLFEGGRRFEERLRPKDRRIVPEANGRRVAAGPMARFLLRDDDGLR